MKTIYVAPPACMLNDRRVIDQLFDLLLDAGVPSVVTSGENCLNVHISTHLLEPDADPVQMARDAIKRAAFPADVTEICPAAPMQPHFSHAADARAPLAQIAEPAATTLLSSAAAGSAAAGRARPTFAPC